MARVLVDAYLCRNLGDDLMLTELCERRPDDSFFAPDLRPETAVPFVALTNMTQTGRPGWFQPIWRWDAYVMVGGSMFIDRANTPPKARAKFLYRWLRRCAVVGVMRLLGRPVEVIGCNLGPVETPIGKVLFRRFLRSATRVTVRDAESQEMAREWGIHAIEAPDMVLSLLTRSFDEASASAVCKVVTISVMEWSGMGVEECALEYARLVDELLANPDVGRVQLVGFQDVAIRDDLLVKQILATRDWGERVLDGSYHGNLRETLELFRTSTHVVATRFHSAILAHGLGIPMVQLSYSEKISNYLKSVGWSGAQWQTARGLLTVSSAEVVSRLMLAERWVHRPEEATLHGGREVR